MNIIPKVWRINLWFRLFLDVIRRNPQTWRHFEVVQIFDGGRSCCFQLNSNSIIDCYIIFPKNISTQSSKSEYFYFLKPSQIFQAANSSCIKEAANDWLIECAPSQRKNAKVEPCIAFGVGADKKRLHSAEAYAPTVFLSAFWTRLSRESVSGVPGYFGCTEQITVENRMDRVRVSVPPISVFTHKIAVLLRSQLCNWRFKHKAVSKW